MHRIEKAVTLQSRWWWSSSTYSSLVISFSVINYVVSVSFCAWGVITQRFKKVLIESKGFFVFYTASSSCCMFCQKFLSGKRCATLPCMIKRFLRTSWWKMVMSWVNPAFSRTRGKRFRVVVPSPAGAHLMTLESGGDLAVGRGHVSFLGALIYNEL